MITSKEKVQLLEEFQKLIDEQVIDSSVFAQEKGLDWDEIYDRCGINAGVCFTIKVLAKLLQVNQDDLQKHVLIDCFGETKPKYFDGERKRVIEDNLSFVQFWEDVGWEDDSN